MNEKIVANGMNQIKIKENENSNKINNNYIKNYNSSKLIKEGIFKDNLNLDSPEFQLKNLTPVKINNVPYVLSKNFYSKNYLFKNKELNKFFSLMRISKENLIDLNINESQIKNALKIYCKINHENIQKLLSSNQQEKFYFLTLEYISKGNLSQIIKKNLNENDIFSYFIQILNSILFLHKNEIIFKNISSKNYLLTEDNRLKLSDFVFCCKEGENYQNSLNFEYYSPDLIDNEIYSKSDDIWAIGVLLYEMYFGKLPFDINIRTQNKEEIFECIKKNSLDFSEKKIDFRLKNLIENMLNFNKNKRIKIDDIFQCEWIKKYEFLLFGEPEDFSLKNTTNFDNIQILDMYNNNNKKINIMQRTKTTFDVKENNNKQKFLDKVLNNIQNQPKKIKKKKRNFNSLEYLKTENSNDVESIEQYHNKLKDYKNNNEFINDINNKPRRTTKKHKNNNQKFDNKINVNFDNNNNNNQPLLTENNKFFINGIVNNDEDQKNKDAINMIENANKININKKDSNSIESKKKKFNLIQPSFRERFLSNFTCK